MNDGTVVDYSSLDEERGYNLAAACIDPPEVRQFLATSQGRSSPTDVVDPRAQYFTFKVRPFFGWSATSERLQSFFAEQKFELLAPVDQRTIVDKHRIFCFRVSEAEAPDVVRAAASCGFVSLRGSRVTKPWAPARHKNCRQANPPKPLKLALKEAFGRSRAIKKEIEAAKQAKADSATRQPASVAQVAPA